MARLRRGTCGKSEPSGKSGDRTAPERKRCRARQFDLLAEKVMARLRSGKGEGRAGFARNGPIAGAWPVCAELPGIPEPWRLGQFVRNCPEFPKLPHLAETCGPHVLPAGNAKSTRSAPMPRLPKLPHLAKTCGPHVLSAGNAKSTRSAPMPRLPKLPHLAETCGPHVLSAGNAKSTRSAPMPRLPKLPHLAEKCGQGTPVDW